MSSLVHIYIYILSSLAHTHIYCSISLHTQTLSNHIEPGHDTTAHIRLQVHSATSRIPPPRRVLVPPSATLSWIKRIWRSKLSKNRLLLPPSSYPLHHGNSLRRSGLLRESPVSLPRQQHRPYQTIEEVLHEQRLSDTQCVHFFEKAKATCTWQYVVADPKTSGCNRRPCPSLQSCFGCNHDLNRRRPHVICGTSRIASC